jgi:NAD(P)H dehydrogenase (quinone)
MTAIAVIYYSATGNVHRLAEAIAAGAQSVDAETRLRRVPELAPEEAIQANPAWAEHREATVDVPEASLDDLRWADGIALGTPTRYGNPAAQLKQFIDSTGGLWRAGELADKAATSFTSARNAHGGQESTILALNNVLYHWGSIIVAPGYTSELVFGSGGNPYGTSWASGGGSGPDESTLKTAEYQGRRLTQIARLLAKRRVEQLERSL